MYKDTVKALKTKRLRLKQLEKNGFWIKIVEYFSIHKKMTFAQVKMYLFFLSCADLRASFDNKQILNEQRLYTFGFH